MSEPDDSAGRIEALEKRIASLEKINRALMRRVEEDVDEGGNAFSLFQQSIVLERKVRERTTELESVRQELETSNEQLRSAIAEANAAAESKAQFLANMSHEIRTPMNGILGMLELVLDRDLPDGLRADLETVSTSASALLVLLNDILDLSKIEAGKLDVETIEFDLFKTAEDVVDLFAEQAQGKGLEIVADIDDDLPPTAHSDPVRLRQILTNLIGNAVKFTERGAVTLRLLAAPDRGGNRWIRIEVEDTGIGISDAQERRLFQAFSQADNSTTRRFGGTGLGLTISRQLVHLLGGDISVESVPGRGTTFWLEVPVGSASGDHCLVPTLAGQRIAVVDDSRLVRDVIAKRLRKRGATAIPIEAAANVFETVRRVRTERPGAILVDGDPGEPDVIELVRAMRADERLAGARIYVALPFRTRAFGWRGGEDARVDGVLSKPVRWDLLLRRLTPASASAALPEATVSAAAPCAMSAAPASCLQGRRVLVVEDTRVNQKVTMRCLGKLGVVADLAENGLEAVRKFEDGGYDLILMDCQMPVMDGYEATASIRSSESGGEQRTPIVAMTADALVGSRERCLDAGMDDFVSKPVRRDDLRAVLERWLGT